MKRTLLLIGAALAIVSVGCKSTKTTSVHEVPPPPTFQAMDPGAQKSVNCSEIQKSTLPDGRLQVAANIRNLENRRLQVQINCVFKDEQGFEVDSTPWNTLILTENATETERFVSANNQAKLFTIRVREAR